MGSGLGIVLGGLKRGGGIGDRRGTLKDRTLEFSHRTALRVCSWSVMSRTLIVRVMTAGDVKTYSEFLGINATALPIPSCFLDSHAPIYPDSHTIPHLQPRNNEAYILPPHNPQRSGSRRPSPRLQPPSSPPHSLLP